VIQRRQECFRADRHNPVSSCWVLAADFVRRFRRYLRAVEIISGLFLIIVGLMLLTGRMSLVAIWAQRNDLFLN